MIKLSATVDENIIEEKLKTVLSIFSSVELNKSALMETQRDDLVSIANDYGLYGGDAVYYARAYLNLFIDDDFENQRRSKPTFSLPKNHLKTSLIAKDYDLYPNPASNRTQIVFNSKLSEEKVQITILDLTGKVVYLSIKQPNVRSVEIDCSFLNPGCYLVNFNSNKIVIGQCKLIIER